jgi:hypothetical protein
MTFGKPATLVHVPHQEVEFDVTNWVHWFSDITTPTIEKVSRLSSAICEPVTELALWQPRNGFVSSIEIQWDTIQVEESVQQISTVIEEDMLEALLTLDLDIPSHSLREVTARGRVMNTGKWTPPIIDPEGFVDLED